MNGPLGTGRRNPHCSNCGDERGGPFGHEISECTFVRIKPRDLGPQTFGPAPGSDGDTRDWYEGDHG